ncbi:TonB-dependent receptor [Gammaproteobacteria bacterium]|nr:TonB-dependent receptor [Gammaproteobacteria bacterium]
MSIRKLFLIPTFFILTGLYVQDVIAQESSESRLEEVVVTAQKKEQGLSEVPISIQVLSSERINDIGVSSWEEIAQYVPGLTVAKGVQEQSIYMRGVGSGTNRGFEQSVTQFVDGMSVTRSQQYTVPLLDLERIEVLKGTQGVLFGKNTIAGVINTVSKSPVIGGDLDAHISHEFVPDWSSRKTSMATNIPINENFAMRIALSSTNSDGWVDNAFTFKQEPSTSHDAIRATFLYELDDMEVNLKLFKSESDRTGQHSQVTHWGLSAPPPSIIAAGRTVAVAAFTVANIAFPQIGQNVGKDFTSTNSMNIYGDGNPNGGTNDAENKILNIKTSLSDHDLSWTSTMSEYDFTEGADADMSPLDFLSVSGNEQFESTTHELVITSPSNDKFEYVAGFFIEETEYSFQNEGFLNGDLGSAPVTNAVLTGALGIGGTLWNAFSRGMLPAKVLSTHHHHDLETSSQSVFAEGTWYLNDQLSLTAGVRWSDEEKELMDSQFLGSDLTSGNTAEAASTDNNRFVRNILFGVLGRDRYEFPLQKMAEDHVTPSVKINYEFSDTTRMYLSWAEGYKSGGFDASDNVKRVNYTTPDPSNRFTSEEATTTEIGLKFDLQDQNLRANLAAFSTEYLDMQVSAFVGASFVVSNAGASTIEGFEGDFEWSPLDGLYVGGAFTYLDFTFDEFIGGCTAAQDIAFRAANNNTVNTPMGPMTIYGTCSQDLKGKTGVNAPEMSSSLYSKYIINTGNGFNVVLGADVNKIDEYFTQNDLDPFNLSPETTKVNVRIGIEADDNKWSLVVFGRNVTNEVGQSFGVDLPLVSGSHVGYLQPGREVGMRYRANF